MRVLEVCLFLVTLAGMPYLLRSASPGRNLVNRLAWPVAFGVVLAAQVLVEGARWQLYPLYLVPVIAGLGLAVRHSGVLRSVGALTLLVLALAGGFLAYALPVPQLPAVSQPLGTFTHFFTDDSREEAYSPTPGGPRQFMAQFWYPADAADVADKQPEPWSREIVAFGRELAASQGLPTFLLDHMSLAESHAYAAAKPAEDGGGKYPVVLYSHGWTGFRTIASNEIERIAAAGFVVIAPDHTYGAAGTVFPDGRVVLNNPKAMPEKGSPERQARIEQLVDSYAGDLIYLLDILPKLESGEIESPLKGRIDLSRIGVFGHSTGGGAVVEAVKRDERIKAIAGLDIWCEPVSPALRDVPRSIPVASVRSQNWHDNRADIDRDILYQILASFSGPKYDLYLAESQHADFTIVPLLSPLVRSLLPGQRGTLPVADTIESVDGFLAAFFQQTLRPESGVTLPEPPATTHAALRPGVPPTVAANPAATGTAIQ
jgi:hypothetical protein